jgi:tetratricopeptide (TPR) repeat protein
MFEGEKLLQAGNSKEAAFQFEQATQHLPMEWRAWNFLGLARHRAGNLEGANQAYKKAVELVGKRRYSSSHPSFVLEFNLGRLCLDRKRPIEAQNHLVTFAAQDQSFAACYWLAEAYRANGHAGAAAEMLARAITLRPDSAVTWNRLGVVQLKLGQATNAIASFVQALKYKKEFAVAQRNLAVTYHRHAPVNLANPEELAMQAFKEYLALEPTDADAVQIIADKLEAKLHPERAAIESAAASQFAGVNTNATLSPPIIPEPPLKPLVASNLIVRIPFPGTNAVTVPSPLPPQKTVVISLATPATPPKKPPGPPATTEKPPVTVAKANPTATLPEKVRPVVPEFPGFARYQYNRPGRPQVGDNEKARKIFEQAFHHHKLNQLDEAIVNYQKVLVLDPSFQQAHLNSAIAYQAKDQIKKALTSYELALAINPLSRESRYGFAQSLHRSKFYVDAAREFERLIEVYDTYLPGHLELAIIYAGKLEMPGRAKAHYRRVLELNPQHPEAAVIREWLLVNNRP